MLNKIIGVTLEKALDADIVWTKTPDGYSASCDAEKKPLVIAIDELPPDARRDDHSLFTFVTSDGISKAKCRGRRNAPAALGHQKRCRIISFRIERLIALLVSAGSPTSGKRRSH